MKRVFKEGAPASFDTWKSSGDEGWNPTYKDFQKPQKQELHQALILEQGYVCCYCGRSISAEDSHIEHFRPQETYADLALEYLNLHASCIRETKPGMPLHCGHTKGNEFNEQLMISPLDDCEARFFYSLDGRVRPCIDGDEPAEYMVGILQLDIDFLRDQRSKAIQSVFDNDFISTATEDELQKLADAYSAPDQNGALLNFGHVLVRYANQLLAPPA